MRVDPEGLRLPMAASPATVGLAWSLVEQRLLRWGVAEAVRYDVHLVLAELLANAVAATPVGLGITVDCHCDERCVIISVSDPSPVIPPEPPPVVELSREGFDLSEARFDDNGGWGLTIVKSLCVDYGVSRLPAGGNSIWS